jgi:hypothetical protein
MVTYTNDFRIVPMVVGCSLVNVGSDYSMTNYCNIVCLSLLYGYTMVTWYVEFRVITNTVEYDSPRHRQHTLTLSVCITINIMQAATLALMSELLTPLSTNCRC